MPEKKVVKQTNGTMSTMTDFASANAANGISVLLFLTLNQFVTLDVNYIIIGIYALASVLSFFFPPLSKKKRK